MRIGDRRTTKRIKKIRRSCGRRIAANIAKLPECFAKKQQAHRVLRPVGRSLLMEGSNYFCFVVSPFM
jgi:hypothetical protein